MRSCINPNFEYEDTGTPPHNWVIEQHVDSDNLLITVGDSWTWGHTLCRSGYTNPNPGTFFDDRDHRIKNVYGYHLHKMINCDWINLAICGSDNISMIDHCWKFVKTLAKSYRKISIVLTLTETGRELNGRDFLTQKNEYQRLRGPDWPDFLCLVADDAPNDQIDFFRKECIESELQIVYSWGLYQSILGSESITEMLERLEKYSFDLIAELLTGDNITCTIARNFVDNFQKNTMIKNLQFTNKKWTDVIAEKGGLTPYPTGIKFLGNIAIDPITRYAKRQNIGNKQELLELLQLASHALDWLDQSPFNNSHMGYKYPKESAHKWWADYLYNHVVS